MYLHPSSCTSQTSFEILYAKNAEFYFWLDMFVFQIEIGYRRKCVVVLYTTMKQGREITGKQQH